MPACDDRVALVVAGMHRSGTSVCADVLSGLGVRLPRRPVPADGHNVSGYFEPRTIVALNEALLRAAGSAWADWYPLPERWWQTMTCRRLLPWAKAAVQMEFGGASRIAIKDPRIGRMCLPWIEVLAQMRYRTSVVLPFRHPRAVMISLVRRSGMSADAAYLLWLRHVLDAERATRDQLRIFIAYEELLACPASVLGRAASGLRLLASPPSEAVCEEAARKIKPALQHGADGIANAAPIPAAMVRAYESYCRLQDDPYDRSAGQELDRLAYGFDAAIAEVVAKDARAREAVETATATLAALDRVTLTERAATTRRRAPPRPRRPRGATS
jgi:hypothetical protein